MDGSRSGTGKCSFSTGDLYEGGWLADVPHGDGRLDVLLGNLKYEGVFAEGRPSQVPSKMNVTFPSEATAPAGGAKKGGKGPATDEAPTMPVSARAVGGGRIKDGRQGAGNRQRIYHAGECEQPSKQDYNNPVTPCSSSGHTRDPAGLPRHSFGTV